MTRPEALYAFALEFPARAARLIVKAALTNFSRSEGDEWRALLDADDDGREVRGLGLLLRVRDIPPATWKKVVVNPCAKCGATEEIQADHIHPFSKGGSHRITNLQPLCKRCNVQKKDR